MATHGRISKLAPTIRLACLLPAIAVFAIAAPALAVTQDDPTCADTDCHGPLLQHESVHAAAADGECETCHELLAGEDHDFEPMPDPIGDLCLMCHDNPVEEATTKHFPAAIGACTACHNPHASDTAPLLRSAINELCLSCHAVDAARPGFDPPRVPLFDGMKGHPNIKHPVTGVPDPTEEGSELNCASCHDPHAEMHTRLLKGGSGYGNCKRCHDK